MKNIAKKINVSNKLNLSSNIKEGIRAVLFFKRKDFIRTKITKRKQATFLLLDAFYVHKKHKTLNAIFFLLDVFMRIKSLLFYTQKH